MPALVLASLALVRPASALQPVTEFIAHAQTWNPMSRAAHAQTEQKDAEVSVATGGLLPAFNAQASYTRNQYEVNTGSLLGGATLPAQFQSAFPNTVIQPQNQLDASLQLEVPIINVASWERRSISKAARSAAQATEASTVVEVQKAVLKGYYQLLGAEALHLSAQKNLEVSRQNVKLANDRKESGTASAMDVQRALADQARVEQSVTGALLEVTVARRGLYSLSGVEPEPASAFLEDDLHEEPRLERFMSTVPQAPAVQTATANRVTAEKTASAANLVWLPSVSGSAQERFTNATAFIGNHSAVYALALTARWSLDATLLPQIRAQNAAAAAAKADEDRVRMQAEDAVFQDWNQIRAGIDSARSARAQVKAASLAASLAQDRYESGIATQLDVLQARQDAFAADVARIQADADLAYARAALRLDAGQLQESQK